MTSPTFRIEKLRQHALEQKDLIRWMPPRLELYAKRAWLNSYTEPWIIIRHARETAAILTEMTPVIDDNELIVGKFDFSDPSSEEIKELSFYHEKIQPATIPISGMKAHMAIDFDQLLRLGIDGIRKLIAGYQSRLDPIKPDDLQKEMFYRACLITLDGLVTCAQNYAQEAAHLADLTSDPERKQELTELSRIMTRIPEFPVSTFYEAIQAAHFVTFCLCAGHQSLLYQYGRPDRYLYPYYKKDLTEGRITREKAQELIDCLGIILTEYTPQGLAIGWMLGGRNASGEDITNELTELFLESIEHVRLSYPDVGLCWSQDTPASIMERSGRLLAKGYSHPAIFNDPVITSGLNKAGLPPAEACLYQNSTCVEITPIASSNVYVASPYINLLQLLHDILNIPPWGKNQAMVNSTVSTIGGLIVPLKTFDELLSRYRQTLSAAVRTAILEQNTLQATRYYHGGQPLLSCFVNDCLARGVDIDQGGARYNWIEPSFVGLSNLVDSLESIKRIVFEDRQIDLETLLNALRNNFLGNENIRLLLLNRVPKYGNDDNSIDSMAAQVTQWIETEVKHYQSFLGGKIISGFFTWIMHEQLGSITGASADGRKAGFPLSAGSGASQGCEKAGPTAAVLSTTKWDHSPHLGGIALNLKFTKPRDDEYFEQRMMDIIRTYLDRGGFEVQVNVVDKVTLLAAQQDPEQYRDLVVRIGGYSDYFVKLSPEMQAEIMLRSEHTL
jgi:pyruvate-formate lyase